MLATITVLADIAETRRAGLSEEHKQAAVPKRIAMLEEADAKSRGYAAQTLAVIGRPEADAAIPVLEALRDDPDEFARRLIRDARDELQKPMHEPKDPDPKS